MADRLDYLTHEGSIVLANRISAHWQAKGFPIVRAAPVRILENIDPTDKRAVYAVRSNLVGGLPPKVAA